MSSSTHQIKVKAVDNTASGFKSIQKTAFNASTSIKKMIGGAVAAAGTVMGVNSIMNVSKDLDTLSKTAMRTGVEASKLQSIFTAFDILGLAHGDITQFGKALVTMQKNTGESGLDGLFKTLENIRNIDDTTKRTSETFRIFGDESGQAFLPLVNSSKNVLSDIKELQNLLPELNPHVLKLNEHINDAFDVSFSVLKTKLINLLSDIAKVFGIDLGANITLNMLNMITYVEYALKRTKNTVKDITSFFVNIIKGLFKLVSWPLKLAEKMTNMLPENGRKLIDEGQKEAKGGQIDKAIRRLFKGNDNDKEYSELQEWLKKSLAENKKIAQAIEKVKEELLKNNKTGDSKDNSDTKKTGDTLLSRYAKARIRLVPIDEGEDDDKYDKPKIINDLIYGNTNEATKLAMLGPELNKAEKHLESIDNTTKKMREKLEQQVNNYNDYHFKEIA